MPPAAMPMSSGRDLQSAGGSPSTLDGPPPTMGLETPDRPPQGLADLVSPQAAGAVPPDQVPEPVLRGVMEAGQQMDVMLQSFAQIFPALSADFSIVSLALQRALGKVVSAGAPAVTPTAAGAGFPGGGLGSTPQI